MNILDSAKIFSGTSVPNLSKKVANKLCVPLGKIEIERFSDGEIKLEINEVVRGHKIFLIQSTCSPANNTIMEMLIAADAFNRSSAKVTAVIPYFGYARQDRRPNFTRTPITASLVATLMEAAKIKQIITIDLHSGQQQGFFNIPVLNLSATPLMVADIWRKYIVKDVVVVSPDAGGVVRAREVAKLLNDSDMAIVDKRRQKANESEVMNVIGNVENKTCAIVDDMIDTAGTLCKSAIALKERGANKIIAYATHPVFSGPAFDRIEKSCIDEIVVSDTIPLPEIYPNKIKVVSVAELIAETIFRVNSKKSVSEMFTGH